MRCLADYVCATSRLCSVFRKKQTSVILKLTLVHLQTESMFNSCASNAPLLIDWILCRTWEIATIGIFHLSVDIRKKERLTGCYSFIACGASFIITFFLPCRGCVGFSCSQCSCTLCVLNADLVTRFEPASKPHLPCFDSPFFVTTEGHNLPCGAEARGPECCTGNRNITRDGLYV